MLDWGIDSPHRAVWLRFAKAALGCLIGACICLLRGRSSSGKAVWWGSCVIVILSAVIRCLAFWDSEIDDCLTLVGCRLPMLRFNPSPLPSSSS